MSRKEEIKTLIRQQQRLLHELEKQRTLLGLHAPAHIQIQWEDTQASLEDLQNQLLLLEETEPEQAGSGPVTKNPSPPPSGSPSFQISGNIQAANVNLGGTQQFEGHTTLNPDFSEHHTTNVTRVTEGGVYITGQGNSYTAGVILDVRSQLDEVSQRIGALSTVGPVDKEALIRLAQELKQQLSQIPPDRAGQAEKIAKRLGSLINELEQDKPDPELVDLMGTSLKKAAQNLAGVMPTVLTIADRIVAYALKLVGSI